MTIGEVLERVAANGAITAADALAVRRAVYGTDLAVTPDEIEKMLQVDEAAASADRSWTQLFIEAGRISSSISCRRRAICQ